MSKRVRLPTAAKRRLTSTPSKLDISPYTNKKPAITNRRKWLGAHVSAAGGLEHAILNAREIGADALAFFIKSRQWAAKPLDADKAAEFRRVAAAHGFDHRHMLPHCQYIVNLGTAE